jgi:TatD DNase family protein
MQFFDTHCHIQFADYPLDAEETIAAAHAAGVKRLMIVGCTLEDSEAAVPFVRDHDNTWASIGLHPHEAHHYVNDGEALNKFAHLATQPKVVAVGETGLDYFYNHSPREAQIRLLEFQLDLARQHNLPVVFHVREAFDDFWPIFDNFRGLRGVVHSFTSTTQELDRVLSRGLYVGLNGIMTFTKHQNQLDMARAVPADRLLLETDAPFLTPDPYRGKVCEPKHVVVTAEFLSRLRGESIEDLSQATTSNACRLFSV